MRGACRRSRSTTHRAAWVTTRRTLRHATRLVVAPEYPRDVKFLMMPRPLDGKVALVAGATRGAGRGTAVALGEAGATVYCTGRSTRERRSEYDRPETIEETAELVTAAGGVGIAIAVDHLEAGEVEALVQRIDAESGRLDVLVNDIWGGRAAVRVEHAGVGARPREGAADSAPGDRHAPDHQPLRAAAADPRARRAGRRDDRRHARVQRRALPASRPSTTWPRPRSSGSRSRRARSSPRTGAPPWR